MEIILLAIFMAAAAAPPTPPAGVYGDGVNVDPGFGAYTLCQKEGVSYDPRQNKVVRENGVLKIVRACKCAEKKPAAQES